MLKSKKLFSVLIELGKMKKKVCIFFNGKSRSEGNSLHASCKSIWLN